MYWVAGRNLSKRPTRKGCNKKITTVVAKMITEFIRFEPEIRICHGNYLELKRESAFVTRDFLLLYINFPRRKCLSVINLDTTVLGHEAARECNLLQ